MWTGARFKRSQLPLVAHRGFALLFAILRRAGPVPELEFHSTARAPGATPSSDEPERES